MKSIIGIAAVCISMYAQAVTVDQETQCLAKNVYHEARGEPWQGKMAVAIVTINRTNHWQFPNTICKVVYQPGQFSWTQHKLKVIDMYAWNESVLIAQLAQALAHEYAQKFPALYFHNKHVRPMWQHKRKIAQIGNHIFYK